jgi:hypothetical protein
VRGTVGSIVFGRVAPLWPAAGTAKAITTATTAATRRAAPPHLNLPIVIAARGALGETINLTISSVTFGSSPSVSLVEAQDVGDDALATR